MSNNFTFQQVGAGTSSSEIQCLCNHLTSFAGQVFVVPNVIDVDKLIATTFLELLMPPSSNEIILSIVIAVFFIYILLLVWARRLDVHNEKKVSESSNLQKNLQGKLGEKSDKTTARKCTSSLFPFHFVSFSFLHTIKCKVQF